MMAQISSLRWLQEDCGHQCEVATEEAADGSWSLNISCGCEGCEHYARKVASYFFPDIATVVVH